jgi:hypothetical protein
MLCVVLFVCGCEKTLGKKKNGAQAKCLRETMGVGTFSRIICLWCWRAQKVDSF